jgi:hypothetical protein
LAGASSAFGHEVGSSSAAGRSCGLSSKLVRRPKSSMGGTPFQLTCPLQCTSVACQRRRSDRAGWDIGRTMSWPAVHLPRKWYRVLLLADLLYDPTYAPKFLNWDYIWHKSSVSVKHNLMFTAVRFLGSSRWSSCVERNRAGPGSAAAAASPHVTVRRSDGHPPPYSVAAFTPASRWSCWTSPLQPIPTETPHVPRDHETPHADVWVKTTRSPTWQPRQCLTAFSSLRPAAAAEQAPTPRGPRDRQSPEKQNKKLEKSTGGVEKPLKFPGIYVFTA